MKKEVVIGLSIVLAIIIIGSVLSIINKHIYFSPSKGDVNADGSFNILDIHFLVNYLFKGGPAPETMLSADLDTDNQITIADLTELVSMLKFKGDINRDGYVDHMDVDFLVAYLFENGPAPQDTETADFDGDNQITIADLTLLVQLTDIKVGDINNDKKINQADVDFLTAYLFEGGPAPSPIYLGDVDGSGQINVADVTLLVSMLEFEKGDINKDFKVNIEDVNFLVAYLFQGGQAPNPIGLGDVDNNGEINVADLTYLVEILKKTREIKTFVKGDLNKDGFVDKSDVDFLTAYLFEGGPAPDPLLSADLDNNGEVNVADLTFLVDYALFKTGDLNKDKWVNKPDIDFLVAYLFQGGPAPDPIELGDIDGNGQINIADLTLLVYLSKLKTGDVNKDGVLDKLDVDFLTAYLFENGEASEPRDLMDINADGTINIADLTLLVALSELKKGDINQDGFVDQKDIDFLTSYLFASGEAPSPMDLADLDSNGEVNVADLTYLVNIVNPPSVPEDDTEDEDEEDRDRRRGGGGLPPGDEEEELPPADQDDQKNEIQKIYSNVKEKTGPWFYVLLVITLALFIGFLIVLVIYIKRQRREIDREMFSKKVKGIRRVKKVKR